MISGILALRPTNVEWASRPKIGALDAFVFAAAAPIATEVLRAHTATILGASSALTSLTVLEIAITAGIVHAVGMSVFAAYQGKEAEEVWTILRDQLQTNTRFLAELSLVLLLNMSYPHFLIHEGGHALAALLCFVNPSPAISIRPFLSGSTAYAVSYGLTSIGRLFGKEGSMGVAAAGGLAASTFFAMGEWSAADQLEKKWPHFSRFLKLHGLAQLFHDGMYALQALTTSRMNRQHDLITLWNDFGIHPFVPIALMIGLPLLEKAALHYYRSGKTDSNQ